MEWTDKENHIAVFALHKCEIEKAHIFLVTKTAEYYAWFVYRTVKLFLDTGGVSNHKRSSWPRLVHTSQVINTVRSRINRNPV